MTNPRDRRILWEATADDGPSAGSIGVLCILSWLSIIWILISLERILNTFQQQKCGAKISSSVIFVYGICRGELGRVCVCVFRCVCSCWSGRVNVHMQDSVSHSWFFHQLLNQREVWCLRVTLSSVLVIFGRRWLAVLRVPSQVTSGEARRDKYGARKRHPLATLINTSTALPKQTLDKIRGILSQEAMLKYSSDEKITDGTELRWDILQNMSIKLFL